MFLTDKKPHLKSKVHSLKFLRLVQSSDIIPMRKTLHLWNPKHDETKKISKIHICVSNIHSAQFYITNSKKQNTLSLYFVHPCLHCYLLSDKIKLSVGTHLPCGILYQRRHELWSLVNAFCFWIFSQTSII